MQINKREILILLALTEFALAREEEVFASEENRENWPGDHDPNDITLFRWNVLEPLREARGRDGLNLTELSRKALSLLAYYIPDYLKNNSAGEPERFFLDRFQETFHKRSENVDPGQAPQL